MKMTAWGIAAGCGLALGLAAMGKAQGHGTAQATGKTRTASAISVPGSVLDRLPRVKAGGYAAALAAARARGAEGSADALWIELFYGDPAAQAEAERALEPSAAMANTGAGGATAAAHPPELAFLQFLAAYSQGQDRQMLEATLRLLQVAPDDVATELAVRALSGQLGNQGRALLDAVPPIERVLEEPLQDPTTSYMLGRSLLAAIHAPGLALTEGEALRLSGRLTSWQLWGPFGKWQNLDFDRDLPIEKAAAASYDDNGQARTPQAFDSAGGAVHFPLDWNGQGVDFATTYVRAAASTRVLLRLYTQASAQVSINGVAVMRNDRRSSYTTGTGTAAVELAAGWNRVVVKLAGETPRDFDLMVRPETPAARETELTGAAEAPKGSQLAGAPKLLAAPPTLAEWSAQRLASDGGNDAVALWVDGIRRLQDEDAENARVELQKASVAAPNAAPVWLDLAEAYSQLPDASQSWAASQVEVTAQHALKVSPHAVRAYDRLGHVYESEGKQTEAAEQYAQCAGKGFADCDWSEFHLAASQRWLPEAETALGHALTESGSDWNSIASGMEFYDSVGDAAKVADWKRVLSADPRASAALGAYELRQGQATEATALFKTAIGFDPSAAEPRREYLEALLLSGDLTQAQTAATAAVAAFPDNWQIAAEAGEIGLRQNLGQGIAELRRTDFNRNILRHEADYLANDKFWQPWYHSAAELLRDAPGKAEYPNASSILVFDQMVNRINPDSSQDQYIHQIYRVLNAVGIEQLGDVKTITPGSDLITVRTIKQDGTMLLPEKIASLSSISMPGLEAGDYIEIEFVQHTPASEVIPGTMDNSEFFVFNSSTQPYHYSDYIVLTPPGYPTMVDQTHFPAPPTVTTLPGGDTAREWLVQKTRLLVTEPNMPPEQELVPRVWVSSEMSWDDISLYLADHLFDVRKATPEMAQEAVALTAGKTSAVERADAVFDWVTANIQPGEGSLVPARQFFTDRDGNRMATFLGLLSAAQVPYQVVMARGVTDDSSIKIPSLFQFQYPLVHVSGGNSGGVTNSDAAAAGWYDLNNDFAQERYIVPGMRGGLALVAGGTGDGAFTHVPSYSSELDGVALTVTGTVAESGDATLHLEIAFRGPNGEQVREALANQPDSQLPQVYQQMVLANYPNATATGGKIENLADKTKPLIIAIEATAPGFVHVDGAAGTTATGAGWDIDHLAGAVGLLARYAPLPFREEPLVISGESFEQTEVKLTLPARFGAAVLPPAANLSNQFGRFTSSFTQTGSTIDFQRLLDLKANLIPPSGYAAFRAFGEAVDNQDRLQLTGVISH